MNARRSIQSLKQATTWVFLAVFMACSSVAPGMMPSRHPSGITMVLCTSAGLTEVVIDANGKSHKVKHKVCDWSVNHAALDATALPFTPPRPHFAKLKKPFTATQHVFSYNSVDRHRPRAPPITL